MSAVTSIQNTLDPIALALGQESASRQSAAAQNEERQSGDQVRIDEGAYQRKNIDLNLDAKTISFDEAMSALDYVQGQSPEALSQVHGTLDAGRVYQLLGLSD